MKTANSRNSTGKRERANGKSLECVSWCSNAFDTRTQDVKVAQFLHDVATGRYAKAIQTIRAKYWSISDKKRAKKAVEPFKTQLPGVLWRGLFKSRHKKALIKRSRFFCADLDFLGERLKTVRKQLIKSKHLFALFLSPSGDGLKAIFIVPAGAGISEKALLRATQPHVTGLTGIESLVEECDDVAKLCFTSYDPDLYTNWDAVELKVSKEKEYEPKPDPPPTQSPNGASNDDRLGLRRAIAEKRLGHIGEWKSEGKSFWARCECPRGHDDARVYVNPDGSMRLHCAGREARACYREVIFVDEWFKEQLKLNAGLPQIEDLATLLSEPIVLPEDIIKGLLSIGGKMVLGGGSKTFKTWMLVDLAIAVSAGTKWLSFSTKQGRVLYINLELQKGFFSYRSKVVSEHRKVTIGKGTFDVWNLRGHAQELERLMPAILANAGRDKYDLVIIDPIYKVLGRHEENVTHHLTAIMNQLERIAVQSSAAVAFGAHFSKGDQSLKEAIDRIGGSGVFGRDPDSYLTFTRHEVDNAFTVDLVLRNHPPVEPFCVRFQFPVMEFAPDLDPADLKQRAKNKGGREPKITMEKIWDLLEEEPLTYSEWTRRAMDLFSISLSTFERNFRKLRSLDLIVKTEDEKWTKKAGLETPL
jgi:hypothetical protein